jgi:hypothetical protein
MISVVSAGGNPLMPCRPRKARKLLERDLAEKRWTRLGVFHLRLKFEPKSELNRGQQLCLAEDTGSKWDGLAVVSRNGVSTCAMLVLPSRIAQKLEQRGDMRRGRRYRKTRRRAKRSDNRRRPEGWVAPSQKSKIDFRIRIVDEYRRLYPIARFAVEDVRFDHYRKRWGRYFSTVEIGKTKFYEYLRKLGELTLYAGVETARFRAEFGLRKNPVKRELSWDTHALDAIAIGCIDIGCLNPYPSEFRVWRRFEYARRQLHRLEPDRGGVRRRYGGSWSISSFKKGDVVMWRRRLARVGGFMGESLSLHEFTLMNKRFTQTANPGECKVLFNQQIFSNFEQLQFNVPMNGSRLVGVIR